METTDIRRADPAGRRPGIGGSEKLEEIAGGGRVTLVYGAEDTERNNAVPITEYIRKKWDM